jgi:N-acetylneuraminic acid mutarotase
MKHPIKSESNSSGSKALTRRQLLVGATAAALATGLTVKSQASPVRKQGKRPTASSMRSLRRYMAAAARLGDGRILVTGGYDRPWSDDRALTPLASAVIYDPRTDSWSDAAPLRVPRARHAAVALADGRIAVTGGYGLGPLSSVEVYDPRTNAWTTSQAMSQPRYDHCSVVESDTIYLMGGSSHTMVGSVEALAVTA